MTPPLQVAEPADEPQAALVAACRCRRRIRRAAPDSTRWCHDNGGVTCAPRFDDLVKGDST